MKKRQLGLDLAIPAIVTGVFIVLNLVPFWPTREHPVWFSPENRIWSTPENRVYDALLHLRRPVAEDRSLLFIDIEDTAIAQVGMYPWSRDIMADGLVTMKEFDAAYAVFDIEYTEASPRGVDKEFLEQDMPQIINDELASIDRNVTDLFAALQAGRISLRDARAYLRDLSALTEQSRTALLESVEKIARDNDSYFGQAARLFGKAYFTVNMVPAREEKVTDEQRDSARDLAALAGTSLPVGYPFVARDIRPAILPILKGARGAGFPNVVVDPDGVRRRIDLVMGYDDRAYAQLGFAALLDLMGRPQVQLSRDRIVLKSAALPGQAKRDIALPLAADRRFLINWPHKGYWDSFRHITYYLLVAHKRLEQDLLHNLKIMEDAGYLSGFHADHGLLDTWRRAEAIRQEVLDGGDPALMAEYRDLRKIFFSDTADFLGSGAEKALIDHIDGLLVSPKVSATDKESYRQIREEVPRVFSATRGLSDNLAEIRTTLAKEVPGSFCFIGWTGTSTTDIGVNPFAKEYMNVGTHAAVVNTILTGQTLDALPWWMGAALALVFSFVVMLAIRRLEPLPSILVGAGVLLVLIAATGGVFLLTGTYVNVVTPALSVFFTLFALILLKFLSVQREKSFIRNAFSHYLSADVVTELVSTGQMPNLGGETKYLTAMFTDLRGFSTISEKLKEDPQAIVSLLNYYLEEMSNIILAQRGTIDKYEGDAIIAFFGAPLVLEDHAARACRSALYMKKMERIVNEHVLRENLSPAPVATRIGINTGNMVVGNMGTRQRMDYTIMGDPVNLAARLEGVNKQYGTWILVSEWTRNEAGDSFFFRQLDTVKVVGKDEPVRLFELIDEKSAVQPKTVEAVEIFHEAHALFVKRQWDAAASRFEQVQTIIPDDGPSATFIRRCTEFKKQPPPENWTGVYKLDVK
jgi:adenylate cyclase